ncbi:hypothetical protein FXN63_12820 [Pigmentiphaga aceris]|uniref:Alpha/beta hydrolase n=2 Tax=Pigmentiphaga aceris TaxID=1940612 RepID=A0A5C0B3K0_9BURK|nr:hypothetical protein FXN63_12820 [Pigmentiphaga aceris]
MKTTGAGLAALGFLSLNGGAALAAGAGNLSRAPAGADNFFKSDNVTVQKVTFKNQYNMQVAGPAKELVWVPGAGHVDLYDRSPLIPWTKLTSFFTQHLKA